MWSFFKFVKVPNPRTLSIPSRLTKKELLDKIASNTLSKMPIFSLGDLPKFIGEVSEDGFQVVMYLDTPQTMLNPTLALPVNVNGITTSSSTNEIQVELTILKSQMGLFKLMNIFFIANRC